MKTRLLPALFVTALTVASQAHASLITYSGVQENVDPKQTSQPAVADSFGWRNPTPVKPFDVDGDNVIGTDGYNGRAGHASPSYLSFTNRAGGGNPFGYIDNPLDPTGIDTARVGFQGSGSGVGDLFSFQITDSSLNGQVLGVAVQFDGYNSGSQIFTLEQRDGGVGGSVLFSASSPTLVYSNDGYDFAFFEINSPANGDFFVMTGEGVSGYGRGYSQVAFDTSIVPEPTSVALLLLGGLLLRIRNRLRN